MCLRQALETTGCEKYAGRNHTEVVCQWYIDSIARRDV